MIPRTLSKKLKDLINQYPVLTITGPRQSGKTTICKKIFSDYKYVNLEDLETRELAKNDPKSLLEFKHHKGIIIDEIQKAPSILSYVQVIVDDLDKNGLFVLTGSENLDLSQKITQSLAGRTAIAKVLPLSFNELRSVNFKSSVEELIVKGFYPRIYKHNLVSREFYSFYTNTYIEKDVRNIANIHKLSSFESFIKILATNASQILNYNRISNDLGIGEKTVKSWISILESGYLVYKLNPYFLNTRKRLIKSPKIYFYDTGLLCYLLGINNVEVFRSHPLKGAIFENFIITEMLKSNFNKVKDKNFMFFKDQVGNEIDVLNPENFFIHAIEIKFGKTFNKDMVKNLLKYLNSFPIKIKPILVYNGDKSFKYKEADILNSEEFLKNIDKILG